MKYLHFLSLSFLLILSGSLFAAPSVSVTFVMDESGSVSSSNFQLENQGFINALNGLPTDGSVEISIVGFASSSQTIQSPTVLTSANFNTVKAALEANVQNSGGTNMSGAINHAAGLLNPSSTATKIICLSTDGAPNSSSATTTAATNAKNSGITLSPVGIGLNSSGKTFLDSIASNPPIPNPTDFNEFATVVKNNCVGIVNSALNIQLTPEPVDFGSFNSQTIDEDLNICAKDPEIINVSNNSNQLARVTKIEIVGDDADDFELVSFMGEEAINLTYPLTLSPSFSTQMKVKLKPTSIPADKTYDASIKLTAEDTNQISGTFSTALIAKVDPDIPSCLGVSSIDASPLINFVSDSGKPLKKDNSEIGEIDIALTLQNDKEQKYRREGLVADGNARLLLVSKTRQNTGKIRLEIVNPSNVTGATLYPLDNTPTYISGTRTYDKTGKTSIDLDIATDPDGFGQTTAVLRAGERFLGGANENWVKFKIKACILDDNTCGEVLDTIELTERKTPVILIHGLWSDNNTWFDDNDRTRGLNPRLRASGFRVEMITYDGNEGPATTVPFHRGNIGFTIRNLCRETIENNNIACSRVDIIGHSMGGLFARELVRLNYHNDKDLKTYSMSFGQGVIRRIVTMGTPHFGSPLANVLWADTLFQALPDDQREDTSNVAALVTNNSFINDCIIHPEVSDFDSDGGYDEIHDLVNNIGREGSLVRTGVRDLVIGSQFQNQLNQHQFSSSAKIPPLFVIAGNIGQEYDQSLVIGGSGLGTNIRTHTIGNAEKAGCDYADVLSVDSDGIVPIDSARISNAFLERYSDLNNYLSANIAKTSTTIEGFHHTGMGKEHPFINDDREMDDSREDLNMINEVIDQLLTELPNED